MPPAMRWHSWTGAPAFPAGRHTPGYAPVFAATEHGAADGSDISSIAVAAGYRQLAVGTDGATVTRCLLKSGLQLRRDLAFRLHFQAIQQSHRGGSP